MGTVQDTQAPRSAAVIGSFKQHYEVALEAVREFRAQGWHVTSPVGSPIVEPGIPFVRFETDEVAWDDGTVQTVALHRILRSDLVYVAAPNGYVGRTTCYEIGRIIGARRPIYFSEQPDDLPLYVPPSHVCSVQELLKTTAAGEIPQELFEGEDGQYAAWERRLLNGDYLDS